MSWKQQAKQRAREVQTNLIGMDALCRLMPGAGSGKGAKVPRSFKLPEDLSYFLDQLVAMTPYNASDIFRILLRTLQFNDEKFHHRSYMKAQRLSDFFKRERDEAAAEQMKRDY